MMLLVCIFRIIILGIIIVKRPRTIIWMGRYIRNKLLLLLLLLKRSQLRWAAHVVIMSDERLPKRLLYGELRGGGLLAVNANVRKTPSNLS